MEDMCYERRRAEACVDGTVSEWHSHGPRAVFPQETLSAMRAPGAFGLLSVDTHASASSLYYTQRTTVELYSLHPSHASTLLT